MSENIEMDLDIQEGSPKTKKRNKPVTKNIDDDTHNIISEIQSENSGSHDTRNLSIYSELSKYSPKDPIEVETGIFGLDIVLGHLRKGDIVELSAEPGVGKSTLMLQLCKNIVTGLYKPTYSDFPKVVYIDTEGGVDDNLLHAMGLLEYKGNQLQVLTVPTYLALEELLNKILSSNEKFEAVVIDSITDIVPDEVFEKKLGEIQIGLDAKYTDQFFKKFKPLFRKSGVTLFTINQLRNKSKKVGYTMVFEVDSAGGWSVQFSPDVRLRMQKGSAITQNVGNTINGESEVKIGTESLIWAIKNRKNNPDIKVPIPILFGKGVSNVLFMKNILVKKGYLKSVGIKNTFDWKDGTEPVVINYNKQLISYIKDNIFFLKEKLVELNQWQLLSFIDTEVPY